mmetsp:Transcript_26273/g.61267  ORF Transcript_26273/g.61267 Transcript_26273/m.61267 type:complete len:234 (-) Transcript_26273:174-875(-)
MHSGRHLVPCGRGRSWVARWTGHGRALLLPATPPPPPTASASASRKVPPASEASAAPPTPPPPPHVRLEPLGEVSREPPPTPPPPPRPARAPASALEETLASLQQAFRQAGGEQAWRRFRKAWQQVSEPAWHAFLRAGGTPAHLQALRSIVPMLVFWGYFLTRRSKERAAASKELQPSVPSAMPSVAIPLEGDAGQPVEADSELPTDFASAWAWHGDASRGDEPPDAAELSSD